MVTTDFGTIEPAAEPCTYIFFALKPGKAIITIKKKESNAYKEAGSVVYRVKALPLPHAYVGNLRNAPVGSKVFKAQIGMTARLDDFDFEAYFKIKSFRLEVTRNDQVVFSRQNNGNAFEPKIVSFFATLQAGDKIIFSDILCLSPAKTILALESFDLTIE